MGTPLVTRVPSVRLKREIELLRVRSPKSGAWSLSVSRMNAPLGRPSEQFEEKDDAHDRADDDEDIVLYRGARTDDKLGERGQRFATEHVRENRLELRNDEHQQKAMIRMAIKRTMIG